MNFIIAGPPSNGDFQFGISAQYIDFVVPASAIDFQAFDSREINDTSSAHYILIGNDEQISDRRSIDDNRINACTAADEYRSILKIRIAIIAGSTEQCRKVCYVLSF